MRNVSAVLVLSMLAAIAVSCTDEATAVPHR